MHIIPVIDLCNGQAVHARMGRRDAYQPIRTALCPRADPMEVVRAYLTVYHFNTVYLADLDALEQRGNNNHIIDKLHDGFPALNFWVDAGFTDNKYCLRERIHPIIASEAGTSCRQLALANKAPNNVILSLDFSGKKLKGDDNLLKNAHAWPGTIIVMSLHRVGTEQGPDMDLLRDIKSKAPGKKIFAAGGIRHGQDLERLAALGISGALLASALHNGQINAAILQRYGDI